MKLIRVSTFVMAIALSFSTACTANETSDSVVLPIEPLVGSWSFSGMVANENGDLYGYFFQMQRQGASFHVKTALIDGQTNQLKLFYEGDEQLQQPTPFNWSVGRSFMRYNPINDSWVFGVKSEGNQGFNFKVDMLKQVRDDTHTLILRPGMELQALQTSRLNGHLQTGPDSKEQFVTGNNAWFGKVWVSKKQDSSHDISTTFCRLRDDNGFYSANLKEADATGAAIAGWRDSAGNRVKMSQFVSVKSLADNQCLLDVVLPKLQLQVMNTLKREDKAPLSVAGFSKDNKGFCFVTEQSFAQIQEAAVSVAAG